MTDEYVLRIEDGEIIPCDSCKQDVPTSEFEKPSSFKGDRSKPNYFCYVCAATFAGNSHNYPEQYPAELMQHIAACTNIVLAEVRNERASIAALQADRDRLLEALREALPLVPHKEYDANHCQICGWPLADSMENGCVEENCAYRPRDHSEEWPALRRQRVYINARAAIRAAEEGKS